MINSVNTQTNALHSMSANIRDLSASTRKRFIYVPKGFRSSIVEANNSWCAEYIKFY